MYYFGAYASDYLFAFLKQYLDLCKTIQKAKENTQNETWE